MTNIFTLILILYSIPLLMLFLWIVPSLFGIIDSGFIVFCSAIAGFFAEDNTANIGDLLSKIIIAIATLYSVPVAQLKQGVPPRTQKLVYFFWGLCLASLIGFGLLAAQQSNIEAWIARYEIEKERFEIFNKVTALYAENTLSYIILLLGINVANSGSSNNDCE